MGACSSACAALFAWFVEHVVQPCMMPIVMSNYCPDFLLRFGIRLMLWGQLAESKRGSYADHVAKKMAYVRDLKTRLVAESTPAANKQHYEVPAGFYDLCLGPQKKYSCGLWTHSSTLEDSETEALEAVCARARLGKDAPMRVLDMGCGWGSLTLFVASRYPNIRVTSVSNSASQKAYIDGQAAARGLRNVEVITADIANFDAEHGVFDRVLSIEMMEHAKNYETLLHRVSTWLKPVTGLFFVHIFTHKLHPFHYVDGWMAENFFTGGQMPSDDLLLHFQRHLTLADHWGVNGRHYARTCDAWLAKLDANKAAAFEALGKIYGEKDKVKWFVNWRLFFLACAELFDYAGGEEWAVSHYLFEQKDAPYAAPVVIRAAHVAGEGVKGVKGEGKKGGRGRSNSPARGNAARND